MKDTVKWLIEDFARDNSFHLLADEARRQGFQTRVIRYEPFESGSLDCYPDRDDCVIFQGSYGFAEQVRKEKDWIPGVFANWDNFRCTSYYRHWGNYLLNSNFMMMPFHMLLRHYPYYLKTWGSFFLRPDANNKPFSARLLGEADFCTSARGVNTWDDVCKDAKEMKLDDLVIVAPPEKIHREWRVVCARNEVITGSRYKTWGQVDYQAELPDDVRLYALGIASGKFQPDPVYVLDIGDVAGEGLKLVECGVFSCAGLYHCDMEKIVSRVSEIAYNQYRDGDV